MKRGYALPVAVVMAVVASCLVAASPSPMPVADLDALATTALPLNNASVAYWTARDVQNRRWLAQGGRASVLFLGDSITEGLTFGAGKMVWDTYYAPLGMANFAVSGATTSQVLWQVETGQVAAADPDAVVLLIGTNNLSLGQSPRAIAEGIAKIVFSIQEQLPETRILVLGVLPRGRSPVDPLRRQIAEINRRIAALEDGDRVQVLDIGGWFLQRNGTISSAVMPDYVHPSLWGYQIYGTYTWQPLIEALLDRW